jgi:hypothetical protein
MRYELVPVTKTKARAFVESHHRHNEAPTPAQVSLAVGLEVDGVLVAVATAGYPVARGLNDGRTLEVNRVCVDESLPRNANSILYGAIGRAAKALGFRRMVTYTLESEGGASLRAAGFQEPISIGARSWTETTTRVRNDVTIWGERKNSANVPKYRWERPL